MAGFDRKVKRAQERKGRAPKSDKWEDLMDMRRECIETYVQHHTILVETEKHHKETIKNDVELQQAVKGLNDTYVEIANEIKTNMDKHIDTEPTLEDGKVTQKFKQGPVKVDSDEYFEYLDIYTEYTVILNHILDSAVKGYTALLDRLKVFEKNITDADIKAMQGAIARGQLQIAKAQENAIKKAKGNRHGK